MSISVNLPMHVMASFERKFTCSSHDYFVSFEGKTQTDSRSIVQWHIIIPHHPEKRAVKYILEKRDGQWGKAIGINSLAQEEEVVFLPWAIAAVNESMLTS